MLLSARNILHSISIVRKADAKFPRSKPLTNPIFAKAPKDAEAMPQLIIALGRRYVQYFNTTYRRTGTL
jgi:hypothetical protein